MRYTWSGDRSTRTLVHRGFKPQSHSSAWPALVRWFFDKGKAMKKLMTVKMNDGSTWGVPVSMIALDRAKHYASEFGGDVERSLHEDTFPLFEKDDYAIEDWASNNMNWSDFDGHQVKVAEAPPINFQEAWMDGEFGYVD